MCSPADIDPWAETVVRLNAAENVVTLDFTGDNLIGQTTNADVVLAGDVFYDRDFADRLIPWFQQLAGRGSSRSGGRSRQSLPARGPFGGPC